MRQGDPLSTALFNILMDVVLGSLNEETGYLLGSGKINTPAFADGLILLAESKLGLQNTLTEVEASIGLKLNTAKFSSLLIVH